MNDEMTTRTLFEGKEPAAYRAPQSLIISCSFMKSGIIFYFEEVELFCLKRLTNYSKCCKMLPSIYSLPTQRTQSNSDASFAFRSILTDHKGLSSTLLSLYLIHTGQSVKAITYCPNARQAEKNDLGAVLLEKRGPVD